MYFRLLGQRPGAGGCDAGVQSQDASSILPRLGSAARYGGAGAVSPGRHGRRRERPAGDGRCLVRCLAPATARAASDRARRIAGRDGCRRLHGGGHPVVCGRSIPLVSNCPRPDARPARGIGPVPPVRLRVSVDWPPGRMPDATASPHLGVHRIRHASGGDSHHRLAGREGRPHRHYQQPVHREHVLRLARGDVDQPGALQPRPASATTVHDGRRRCAHACAQPLSCLLVGLRVAPSARGARGGCVRALPKDRARGLLAGDRAGHAVR